MLGFLDNGFFIFLIIALLSAVSEWLSKRRAAKEGDPTKVPPNRPVQPVGPTPEMAKEQEAPGKRKAPSLFDHLEKELRKLADDQPVVEVLDEPRRQPTREQPASSYESSRGDQNVQQISNPILAQQRKLAEIERKKKEAAQKLREARMKASKVSKPKKGADATTQFAGFGTNSRQIRQWLRHRKRLRSAIVLNTLLETPKGLKSPGTEISGS